MDTSTFQFGQDTTPPDNPESPAGNVRPVIRLPKGYDDEASFLAEMRTYFRQDLDTDRLNRDAALEDLRFLCGDQWDDAVRTRREAARKPVLTVNRLPAFAAQVVGARRMNETTIKVVPDNTGTKGIASVREDLIRSIQANSRAELAYDKALEGAVSCGIGNFQVVLDYCDDDVFEQDIKVEQLADHLAVVWDRRLVDPTGADAQHCFVVDILTKKEFYRRWPWATPSDLAADYSLRGDLRMTGWVTTDDVRVVSYWHMRTRKRTLALLQSGAVVDVTDEIDDPVLGPQILAQVVQRTDGSPIMREVNKPFAQQYVCSGLDILEGPYELDIPRVPVFRVPGWEIMVGEWRQRWGLLRFLKDPQRLHNYARSVFAERLMQTPRAVWTATQEAVAGREQDWRNSHLSDNPLLIWNGDSGQKPERVAPAQMEDAFVAWSELTAQDIKDVSNIHEANLGMPSNEVSGVAITARQRVSDTGQVIYHDNLNQAIEQAGKVINLLIPVAYDTPRIIKTLGSDAKENMVVINDFGNPDSIDITAGKYSISVVTGASYATKRLEAAEAMKALANAMPNVLGVAADLIVEAQDWPGADKIAERIRLSMPPELLSPDEITPKIAAKAQAQQQAGAEQAQAAKAAAALDFQKTQSEAAVNFARARNFEATADAVPDKLQNESMATASQAADRELRGTLESIRVATGG